MSVVSLVSGGLDSTLMAVMIKERKLTQHPLFVNYAQLAERKEWETCQRLFRAHSLPKPVRLDVSGYGKLITSGLTDRRKRLYEDAFLPGRNALFLLIGSAYAYQKGANSVAIGFLDERNSIFPDQTGVFARAAEEFLRLSLGSSINVITPLMNFAKADVVRLAEEHGITGTYSCHAGNDDPCGVCISCKEFEFIGD